MDLNALNNVRAWTNGVEVEYDAVAQIKNIASLPVLAGHVAVMPDVHLGKGATVGSVIPTRAARDRAAIPQSSPMAPPPRTSTRWCSSESRARWTVRTATAHGSAKAAMDSLTPSATG